MEEEKNQWLEDRETVNNARNANPELFEQFDDRTQKIEEWIGIKGMDNNRLLGRIKVVPFDFIVQEIDPNGNVVPLIEENKDADIEDETKFIHADLVKIGYSTGGARDLVAKELSIPQDHFTFAGLKDGYALTSQRTTLRTITKEQLQSLDIDQLQFDNIHYGKGQLNPGMLTGNRFTILVRNVTKDTNFDMDLKIKNIKEKGFYNYFSLQRFGYPRLLGHHFGKYLLQGRYDNALRGFLFEKSPFSFSYYDSFRERARLAMPDIKTAKAIFMELPYIFRKEIDVLTELEKNTTAFAPKKAKEVLDKIIPDQVNMWFLAYTSYLANEVLSMFEQDGGDPPKDVPLLGRHLQPNTIALYKHFLKNDGILDIEKNIKFIKLSQESKDPKIPTKIYPKILGYEFIPEGFVISFELPKGVYATTFLANLFMVGEKLNEEDVENLQTYPPIVDTFKSLGQGTLEPLIKKWGDLYKNN